MRLWNQHPIQGRLAVEIQALICRFLFCIGNMIKDLFKCFLLLKTWKYPPTSTKEENYLVDHIPWGFYALPWDREIPVKTMSLTANSWELAGLIIWEMFSGRISLNSVFLLLLVNFVSGFKLELTSISLIENIRSSLTHHHGFQPLVLLP